MNCSSSSNTQRLLVYNRKQPAKVVDVEEPFCESPDCLSLEEGIWRNLRLKQLIRQIIIVFPPIKQVSHVYVVNKNTRDLKSASRL